MLESKGDPYGGRLFLVPKSMAKLQLQLNSDRGNILREDLTGIKSKHTHLRENKYHSEMLRLCEKHNGVGLSASQVGLRENFFFLTSGARIPAKKGKPVAHLCINPVWWPAEGSQKKTDAEGCLSLPGRRFNVERETLIEAEWDNAVGHRVKHRLKGWAARVFQHEHDHLRGITLLESGEEIKGEVTK